MIILPLGPLLKILLLEASLTTLIGPSSINLLCVTGLKILHPGPGWEGFLLELHLKDIRLGILFELGLRDLLSELRSISLFGVLGKRLPCAVTESALPLPEGRASPPSPMLITTSPTPASNRTGHLDVRSPQLVGRSRPIRVVTCHPSRACPAPCKSAFPAAASPSRNGHPHRNGSRLFLYGIRKKLWKSLRTMFS